MEKRSVTTFDKYNFMGLLHHPFLLSLVLVLLGHHFPPFETTFWLRITDAGSVPEMRTCSILIIKSYIKLCIHLSRSIFIYFNYLVIITAGGPVSPRGHM